MLAGFDPATHLKTTTVSCAPIDYATLPQLERHDSQNISRVRRQTCSVDRVHCAGLGHTGVPKMLKTVAVHSSLLLEPTAMAAVKLLCAPRLRRVCCNLDQIKLRLRGKVYEINDLRPIRETLSFRFSITVDELCQMKDYSLKTSNVTRGAPIQELYSGMPSEPTKRRRPTADDDAIFYHSKIASVREKVSEDTHVRSTTEAKYDTEFVPTTSE
ncbi:hypothetical protein J6590_090378 [Homalodisca vitripennis]|nr:hypothetical protein J6590_090378 [Homalodisca vitripennis]